MTPTKSILDRITEPCHKRFDPRDDSRESLSFVCEHCGGDTRRPIPAAMT
jgi:hypothetical protein